VSPDAELLPVTVQFSGFVSVAQVTLNSFEPIIVELLVGVTKVHAPSAKANMLKIAITTSSGITNFFFILSHLILILTL
jgi:hypothetical protein